MQWSTLRSEQDLSVNFVTSRLDGGALEARYVRRVREYFIAYLSSHTGCRLACRFCHLTATGQTMFTPVVMEDYLAQAEVVLQHYDRVRAEQGSAERVNFNWMARGEALANPTMLAQGRELISHLGAKAAQRGLDAHFNISTILPKDLGDVSLADLFGGSPATFYYSLYSLDPAFRRRWMPRAMPAEMGLDMLADWQRATGREVVLHWAFIRGENDSLAEADRIADAVDARGLQVRLNVVRYNPYSPSQGDEAAEEDIERIYAILSRRFGSPRSRVVPRVGFDVKASCGMFVEGLAEVWA